MTVQIIRPQIWFVCTCTVTAYTVTVIRVYNLNRYNFQEELFVKYTPGTFFLSLLHNSDHDNNIIMMTEVHWEMR